MISKPDFAQSSRRVRATDRSQGAESGTTFAGLPRERPVANWRRNALIIGGAVLLVAVIKLVVVF